MTRKAVLGLAGAGLLALASMVPAAACPFGKTADTSTNQQTSASTDQLPVPTDGSTNGSKTGG